MVHHNTMFIPTYQVTSVLINSFCIFFAWRHTHTDKQNTISAFLGASGVQIHVISSHDQSASSTTSIGQRPHPPLTSTLMYAALTLSTSPWCKQPNTPASSLRIPTPKTPIGNCSTVSSTV